MNTERGQQLRSPTRSLAAPWLWPVVLLGCKVPEDRPEPGLSEGREAKGRSGQPDFGGDLLRYQSRLVWLGWDGASAEAVVRLILPDLSLLDESLPGEADRHLIFPGRLAGDQGVQVTLRDRPELAGLLAGSLTVDWDGRSLILESLLAGHEPSYFDSPYLPSDRPAASFLLSRYLGRDGELVIRSCNCVLRGRVHA